jgi:hypothetical protein
MEVKAATSLAWRDPPYFVGKPPKVRGERKGTIMVYHVDRTKLDRKPADEG